MAARVDGELETGLGGKAQENFRGVLLRTGPPPRSWISICPSVKGDLRGLLVTAIHETCPYQSMVLFLAYGVQTLSPQPVTGVK